MGIQNIHIDRTILEPKGYFALVLHAHLPFVRHPEHARFLEEDWFFEALTETYLPLLEVFEGLAHDAVPYRVTLSLTPPLLSMMTDPLLQQRYLNYLDERLEALEGEQRRTTGDANYHPVVLFYAELFTRLRKRFVEQDRMDVSQSFRRLMEAGHLEIITCGATHGYFPLLAVNEESIYAQISMAVRTHERILGRRPRGIWLPECGYKPGVDRILNEFGIEIGGGLGPMAGKIWRIGLMGETSTERNVLLFLAALEACLVKQNAAVRPGSGVAAAIAAMGMN